MGKDVRNISKGWLDDMIIDIEPGTEVEKVIDNKTETTGYNVQCAVWDRCLVWAGVADSIDDLHEQLDTVDGGFTAYLYYFENGESMLAIEYPYEYEEPDKEVYLEGDGAAEVKTFIKGLIDSAE